MLMNIECSIVQSIKVALTFDNNKTKEREISVGDLCYFEFNKNGKRKTIEGKVVKVGASNTASTSSWYIVVDGSVDYSGQMERFSPSQILDVDVIQKHDTAQFVSTPNDSTAVSSMRVVDGVLQVSTDGGYSWMTPTNASALQSTDDEEDGDYGTDYESVVRPKRKPRRKKRVYIEPDDDDYASDIYVDEDESESSSDDLDEDLYDDEDMITDESY